jgi:thymidylate kinase
VLEAYMAIAERAPQRVVAIDATDAIAKVHKKIIGVVEERLLSEPSLPKEKMS